MNSIGIIGGSIIGLSTAEAILEDYPEAKVINLYMRSTSCGVIVLLDIADCGIFRSVYSTHDS